MKAAVNLNNLLKQALKQISKAQNTNELNQLKSHFLGKNSFLKEQFKLISTLPQEIRSKFGEKINQAKNEIELALKNQVSIIADQKITQSLNEQIDISLPGRGYSIGSMHLISQVSNIIEDIFTSMGFKLAKGPEIETDYYNFEALNIPSYHPARAMHDTFYIKNSFVLRTHTSPVQIRAMENTKPPIAIVALGKVYRCDSDLTHSPMFHQMEGLLVDKKVSFADLRGVLQQFLMSFFNQSDIKLRFRSSYFPFTEPSAEVDVGCVICHGKGCRVCSHSGWIEILGSGMVHPNVLKNVGIDTQIYTGYAFGIGVERLAMLRYGIDDMRLFFENNLRFLNQFK